MSAGTITEAGALHGRSDLSRVSSTLALGVLAAGIAVTFAWIGTLGWVSLRLVGAL